MNRRITTRGLYTALAVLTTLAFLGMPAAMGKTDPKSTQGGGTPAAPKTNPQGGDKKGGATIQRTPTNAFEVLKNKVSDIEFYSSNYGIFGLDVANNQAGGLWPRSSGKAYIFGGGVWFGARKVRKINGKDSLTKMSVISYNPNSGASWCAPGRVTEPLAQSATDQSATGLTNNRMYFSSDYNNVSGEPLDATDKANGGPNWPIWDTDPNQILKDSNYAGYVGYFIEDVAKRNTATWPKGPSVISQEDIYSSFKDTDLSRYTELGKKTALEQGYPLGLQFEQTIYTWGFGQYRNFLFIRYNIINKSADTLKDCWMAPAMDMDIGAAGNDHNTIAIQDKSLDSLNMAIQWSDQEATGQFGYLGADFLESPAADANGFLRKDKRFYRQNEQLGLKTFRSWAIAEDPKSPEERYNFMSSTKRDIDNGAGDKRFLMATGPFSMRPGDTARVVMGIMFAYGVGQTPTGAENDRGQIYAIDRFAQEVYDLNFAAPVPPDPCKVLWKPVNNGIELTWDTTSEATVDFRERGLDFSGYKIQRYRKVVGFSTTDSLHTWNLVPKTIATFNIPPVPDTVARVLNRLGPWYRLPQLADNDGQIGSYKVTRIDTVKRPGKLDTLLRTQLKNSSGGDSLFPVFKFRFDPYDDVNPTTRAMVRKVIYTLMDSVTSGRRFIDVGDDNRDGQITDNAIDLSQNERLINNTDYYYNVLAFDAGSPPENTPSKTNTAIATINQVKATPEAPAAGLPVTPTIVSQNGMGGLYNFNFNVIDNLRLSQLFGGDTLEFEFQNYTPNPLNFGNTGAWQETEVIVRSRRSNAELQRFVVNYDFNLSDRADFSYRNIDTTYATRWDTTDAGIRFVDKRAVAVNINNTFQPNVSRPIYNTVGIYKNTFSASFDYTMRQFGDSLRFGQFGDTSLPYKKQLNPFDRNGINNDVNLVGFKQNVGARTGSSTNADTFAIQTRVPGLGQPKLEIEFTAGGTEDITYVKGGKRYTYRNVPYLGLKVRNVASYDVERFDAASNGLKTQTIKYNYQYPADADAASKANFPATTADLGRLPDPGKYIVFPFGWHDADTASFASRRNPVRRNSLLASPKPIGTMNRYYLGLTDGTDSLGAAHRLGFTHKLCVNGAEILLDRARMGSTATTVDTNNLPPDPMPSGQGTDFKAGDKIYVNFTGGVLGMPEPGGKVVVAIPNTKVALANVTNTILDQINVVPNPYMIAHIGQVSNTDHKVYFTELPEQCTIQIYTEAGELLQTVEHKASVENGRIAVNAYDLITRGGRQAQSQLLVARISTPNGAETIKKFAVVVGGFRIISR